MPILPSEGNFCTFFASLTYLGWNYDQQNKIKVVLHQNRYMMVTLDPPVTISSLKNTKKGIADD